MMRGMMGQETLSVIVNLCGKKPVVGFCPSTAGSHVDPLGARQQQQQQQQVTSNQLSCSVILNQVLITPPSPPHYTPSIHWYLVLALYTHAPTGSWYQLYWPHNLL